MTKKKAHERYQNLPKEKKKIKSNIMFVNNIEIFHKMKNKG